jgi:hypothetical protein
MAFSNVQFQSDLGKINLSSLREGVDEASNISCKVIGSFYGIKKSFQEMVLYNIEFSDKYSTLGLYQSYFIL